MKVLKQLFTFLGLLLFSTTLFAQTRITGTVVDANDKEPIIGAAVQQQGTTLGTITDMDGNFELSVSGNNPVLTISFVGYTSKNVTIGDKTYITVELDEETFELDQVIVIGYGVQRKSDLTGSVSSVKADEIRNMPTTSVTQALQGKAAGVEITQNSGSPGASSSVKIRGTGTVNNSNPLYVVDGIPMDDINFISSDDIASIEILKDAASSAIYGSRAANGVVLITTRNGSEGAKPNINFNMYVGWQEAWRNPDIMTKDQYIYFADYVPNQFVRTEYTPNGLRVNDAYQSVLDGGTNWWDDSTRKGMTQKYNVSVSGGTKNINYYVSGNVLMADGIVKESSYDRKSIVGKINSKLSDKVSIGLNINYSHEDRSVVDESGAWGVVKQALILSPLKQTFNSNGEYLWNTPVEMLRRATYDHKKDNFIGQLSFDWDIVKDLRFNSRASYVFTNGLESHFNRNNQSTDIVNDNTYDVKRVPTYNSNLSWDNVLSYNKTFNEIHNFSLMAGQTMEISSYEWMEAKGTGYGGYNDNFDALNYAKFSQSAGGYSTYWRALGFIGRLSYSYKDKYLFQSNFRADASSRFIKKRWGYFPSFSVGWKITGEEFMNDIEWLTLLKVRAGWGQLGNNRVGDYVYGTYVTRNNYKDGGWNDNAGYYLYGATNPTIKQAMTITSVGNPDVTWERTQSTNLGLDANLFKNKLSASFDFFIKDTKDMLLEVPLNYYNGFSNTPVQNAGSVRNTGYEFQASWRDNIGKLKYEIGGNISHIKNKVTSLGESGEPIFGGKIDGLGDYVNKVMVDVPIGSFFGWKTAGIIQEGEDISNLATFKTDKTFGPGDMKFVDINGDGVIDEDDKTFLGSPHPNVFYGFNLNFEYAGFDLSMFFQGVAGNKIYNTTKYYLYTYNDREGDYSNVKSDYFNKVWRGTPGDPSTDYRSNWGANPDGTVPAPNTDSAINEMNFRNSDFYLENGSYLRLKNLQLGYNFNKKVCKKIGLSSLRIYGAVTNVFTITKYGGLDPEVGRTNGQESNNLYLGIDEGTYPQARTYTFGLIFDL